MNYTSRDVIGIVLIVITALLLGYCIVMSNTNTPIALPSSVESTDTERFAVEPTDIEVSNAAAYIFTDKETGVEYLYTTSRNNHGGASMTMLCNPDGTPMVQTITNDGQ